MQLPREIWGQSAGGQSIERRKNTLYGSETVYLYIVLGSLWAGEVL